MEDVTVAIVKKKLSEYISKVEVKGEPIVIKRRQKPVAALVSMEDLELLKTKRETGGLASAIGRWKNFDEIESDVEEAFRSRSDDEERKIPV